MFAQMTIKPFKRIVLELSAGLVLSALVLSCSNSQSKEMKARAVLKPTEGNQASGEVVFTASDKGVKIVAEVSGLTPNSTHGFHIHEFGDCSAPDASSAGGHYNPEDSIHAGPDDRPRHLGDLGNVTADGAGNARYERIDELIVLEGEHSIIGKSVIVHRDEDDLTSQPTGNAGPRVACGIIERVDN